MLYIFIYILYLGILVGVGLYNDIFLLASSGNDDFMQYIDFGNDNDSNSGGNGSSGEGPSETNEKKDTDRLYDYLKPHEGQKIVDKKLINLRLKKPSPSSTLVEKEKIEMSRIFAHVRKENPHFFSGISFENPGHLRLNNEFLNQVLYLKKNYPKNWPDFHR
jgi:hypothetical protein